MRNGRRDGLPATDKGLQAYLQNIKAPDERQWIALGNGLVVCLEPSGIKSFQARVRRKGDAHARRIEIGHFPATSVADARKKLLEVKASARDGRDPSLERRRAKAGVANVRVLGDLIDVYLDRRKEKVAGKTLKGERELLAILQRKLGDRLLTDIEPRDVSAVVEAYARRLRKEERSNGTNANKLLAVTKRLYRSAKGWGLINQNNPAADLARPAKETPRNRILFDGRVLVAEGESKLNEIGKLVLALEDHPTARPESRPSRIAINLCLLLGLRALEVCALEWSAVRLDDEGPSLTITKSKTRAGLRTLPLPRQALALLRELRKKSKGRAGHYVFPAEASATRAQHLHPESLSRAFSRLCELLKIDNVVLHDLRRTALSGLMELGYDDVAERIAGHAGTCLLSRVYDWSNRLDAMRVALAAWADAIEDAVKRGSAAKPLALPAPAADVGADSK
jgi:integrase